VKDFLQNKVLVQDKKPMSWRQIAELRERGHVIGAHSMDHVRLTTDDETVLHYQLAECRTVIEQQLGVSCPLFAWPYGKMRDISVNALQMALRTYDFLFSGDDYQRYTSQGGRVINRRHVEGDWPVAHVRYFLSVQRSHS
jgi:peptidoglycan/xylan/chitin deacetylase (PgdA/CDA1 family)